MSHAYQSVKKLTNRLTLTYLAIIMAMTMGFSSAFYVQSVHEATGNLQRQQQKLRDYLFFTTPEGTRSIIDAELSLFKKNLINRLAVLNLSMLVLGGAVSVFLAKRSLTPMKGALDSQGRFTSDAAHELRTPLTAMKTEIEVSLRDKKLNLNEAKQILSSNLEEISKLQTLTDSLLRLAKDGSNVDKSYWDTYRLADILNSARDRLQPKYTSRNITIDIPNTNLNVYGDSGQLVELFVTLLGNAIKYSHEGSTVKITSSKDSNKKLTVKVIDKGIGIAEVDLPHIFDRFYRADRSRTKSDAEGYGLGLSLAQAIVEAHDGRVSVESTYGKGSTFIVTLPGDNQS